MPDQEETGGSRVRGHPPERKGLLPSLFILPRCRLQNGVMRKVLALLCTCTALLLAACDGKTESSSNTSTTTTKTLILHALNPCART